MARAKKQAAPALIPAAEAPHAVPANWQWVRLEGFCEFERGITFPASAKDNTATESNIPCLRTANVQEKLDLGNLIYVDRKYMKDNEAKLVREGDIIMSSANSLELVGKVSFVEYVPCPMTFGGFVLNIRARNVLNWYLFYFLRSEFLAGHFIRESSQTTNIANINTKTLSAWKLPLPPRAEQARIVAAIEELLGKLDAAEEKLRAAIEGSPARRAALLRRAFTGDLTTKWRAAHGRTMDEWERKKLGEVGDIVTGSTPSTKCSEYYGGEVPFVKPTDLDAGRFVEQAASTLTEEGRKVSRPVRKGSTCICCIGATIGKCGFLMADAVTNQQINTISPYDFMDDVYVYYYCCSNEFQHELVSRSSSTTLPIINKGKTAKLPIPVPPLDEQQEIVRLLDELLAQEDAACAAAEATLAKIPALRQAVLTRAFRGQLGTNDPADPPALSE